MQRLLYRAQPLRAILCARPNDRMNVETCVPARPCWCKASTPVRFVVCASVGAMRGDSCPRLSD